MTPTDVLLAMQVNGHDGMPEALALVRAVQSAIDAQRAADAAGGDPSNAAALAAERAEWTRVRDDASADPRLRARARAMLERTK